MSEEQPTRVEFIDVATGELIVAADMTAEQLPERFVPGTEVDFGGLTWDVERAEPMSAAEWRARGQLKLWLRARPLALASLEDVLYSLPTIVDAIPAVAEGTSKLGRRVLELHEDDWRQVELVAVGHQATIEQELAAIRRIHDEERAGVGFHQLHVRAEIAEPLEGVALTMEELRGLYPDAADYEGLAYQQQTELIAGGYALDLLPGLRVYGVERAGAITALCIQHDGALVVGQHAAERLGSLAAHKGLCLVDWCRAVQVPPRHFAAYFTWQSQEAQQ